MRKKLLEDKLNYISTHTRRKFSQIFLIYGDAVIKFDPRTQHGDAETSALFSNSIRLNVLSRK